MSPLFITSQTSQIRTVGDALVGPSGVVTVRVLGNPNAPPPHRTNLKDWRVHADTNGRDTLHPFSDSGARRRWHLT